MDTAQRIHRLLRAGFQDAVVAAIVGVDPSDVVEFQRDPTQVPTTPAQSGGGLNVGAPSQLLEGAPVVEYPALQSYLTDHPGDFAGAYNSFGRQVDTATMVYATVSAQTDPHADQYVTWFLLSWDSDPTEGVIQQVLMSVQLPTFTLPEGGSSAMNFQSTGSLLVPADWHYMVLFYDPEGTSASHSAALFEQPLS